MALLNIVKEGDPVLRGVCREVTEITPRIITLLDDMRETLAKAEGVGLAAPQVGVRRRIVLVEHDKAGVLEMINPVILKASEEHQQEMEGCLSVPGVWAITDRPMTVTVRAMNRKGEYFSISGTGLTARCFCHEIEHLDGHLFSEHCDRLLTDEELEQYLKEHEDEYEREDDE